MKFLERYSEPAYALLRIMTGLMFLQHGMQKYFGFPDTFAFLSNPLSGLQYAAGGIELVAGILVIIGLCTRPAAFIASGMCAVGYWMVHAPNSFYPIANRGELIALYCFVFLFIATRGAGIWSVDSARKR